MNKMSAFKTIDESFEFLFKKMGLFSFPLIVFIISNMLSTFWANTQGEENYIIGIISIIIAIWAFVITIYDVIDVKVHSHHTGLKDRAVRALWDIPTYTLYNIIFLLMTTVGLLFFIVPGLYLFWAFSFAPLLAILSNKSGEKHFSKSRELAQKNVYYVAKIVAIVLLLQVIPAIVREAILSIFKSVEVSLFLVMAESFVTLLSEIIFVTAFINLQKD